LGSPYSQVSWCFPVPADCAAQQPGAVVRRRGSGFFAVAGAQKALVYGLNPVMAALLGMLTGIGGGMLRDLLVNQIPTVLRADLYALAALAGAAAVVAGQALHVQPVAGAIVGGLLCFGLRFMAIRYGWHLPAARQVWHTDSGNAGGQSDEHR